MRVAIHTLGCKVNQYESQAMEELLRARCISWLLTRLSDSMATAMKLSSSTAMRSNSCTVTAVSDKKSRQAVRQVRRRAPEALIALCGCYPQVSPDQAAALGADLIGGTGDRVAFLDKLEALIQHNESDIKTWIPLEYDLQMTYGNEQVKFSEYLTELRAKVREDSVQKIQKKH